MIERFKRGPCERPAEEPEVFGEAPFIYEAARPTTLLDETGAVVRSTAYPKGFAPTFSRYTLDYPERRTTPSRVFVSSMGDLFGSWVPDRWIEEVFAACQRAPQHTYLFLTKNPARYLDLARDGKLPAEDNFWYGSTVTGPHVPFCWSGHYNTFVSVEPLMEPISTEWDDKSRQVRWIIIGAMTGPSARKHQPKREWVEQIVETAHAEGIPVFMKDNLTDTWGPDLIQEYPEGMVQDPPEKPGVPRCRECEHHTEERHGRRGLSVSCEIGWEAEGYDDRGARPVPAHHARRSPPWCPRREGNDG